MSLVQARRLRRCARAQSELFHRVESGIALALSALLPGLSLAQGVTPDKEYDKYIEKARVLQPLGESPFGERINLHDGSLSFLQTDIEVPGIGPTIRIVRSYAPKRENHHGDPLGFGFGDWVFEIPRVQSITPLHFGGFPDDPREWVVHATNRHARCTAMAEPPPFNYWGDTFKPAWTAEEWWDGYFLHVEGASERILVRAPDGAQPQSHSMAWPHGTEGTWLIGCLPGTANGQPGEAFIGMAPDGTRYWFDQLVYATADSIGKPFEGGYTEGAPAPAQEGGEGGGMADLARRHGSMLVTRIEDRFGNHVLYRYLPDNRLDRIEASDGRLVTFAYDGTVIRAITVAAGDPHAKTWTYQGTRAQLEAVTAPDASKWTFALNQLSALPDMYGGANSGSCSTVGDPIPYVVTGTITAPTGAIGTFTLAPVKHGRSNVPLLCWANTSQPDSGYPYLPNAYWSFTLKRRSISGPGLADQTWAYAYSPANNSWEHECTNGCPGTVWTDVTTPRGDTERRIFSNRVDQTENLLLRTEHYAAGASTADKTVDYAYSLASGPPRAEADYMMLTNAMYWRQNILLDRPVWKRTTTQDGVQFVWQVASDCGAGNAMCFDRFGRPTKITRFSAP